MRRHVIWDWNGTLYDDLPVVVDAVSASMALFDAGPIDEQIYRDHYERPVHRFYDKMLGRDVTPEEWTRINDTFHDVYRTSMHDAALTGDAEVAIKQANAAGCTQSILSMWWHDELVPMVEHVGLDGAMVRVDGNQTGGGDTKAALLAAHVAALRVEVGDITPDRILAVGDSLDDATAAAANGVGCVLYDGGSHHRVELEAAGVPVADSLVHALALGGIT